MQNTACKKYFFKQKRDKNITDKKTLKMEAYETILHKSK